MVDFSIQEGEPQTNPFNGNIHKLLTVVPAHPGVKFEISLNGQHLTLSEFQFKVIIKR